MSAPFEITHPNVGETIQKTMRGLHRARTLDAIEASLSFGLPAFSQHLALGIIRAMVAADAATAWARATRALDRIVACHAWLAQSADSVAALGQAQDAWQSAKQATQEATVAMRQVIESNTHWDGAGAAEQLAKANGQLRAQEELLDLTENLRSGCEKADSVMRSVFQKIAVRLAVQMLVTEGLGQRAPSPTLNMFALNSRVKMYAASLEATANGYERIRDGEGWIGAATSLAANFSLHGAYLATVAANAKAAMPV